MLVKKSIVEKWYQTDSWVYQNFAFLFQNPLWSKSIPRGFSVCPYFWLNLFSVFIFRPIVVWPIQYFFRPILNLLGKPGSAIDTFLFKALTRFGLARSDYFRGGGILATLVLLSIVVGIGCVLIVFFGELVKFYPYITSSTLGTFAFWSITSFLSLFGVIAIHKKVTDTECKTMSYLYIWLVGLLVTAPFFISTEIGNAFSILVRVFGEIFTCTGSGVWIVICFIAKWIWFGLVWAPVDVLVVPWWTYFIAFGCLGLLASYIGGTVASTQADNYREQTTEEYWERNRNSWLALFGRLLNVNDYWNKGEVFIGKTQYVKFTEGMFRSTEYNRACYAYRTTIYRKALEIMYANTLEELKKSYPLLHINLWAEYIKGNDLESRFSNLNTIMDGVEVPDLDFSIAAFTEAIRQAVKSPEIKIMVDTLADEYRNEQLAKETKKTNTKKSWSHIACLRVTTTLNQGAKRIGRGFKWLIVQTGTIIAYLWILIKAKKQGACPYFTFTTPTKLPPQAPSSQATNSPNNPAINLKLKD